MLDLKPVSFHLISVQGRKPTDCQFVAKLLKLACILRLEKRFVANGLGDYH